MPCERELSLFPKLLYLDLELSGGFRQLTLGKRTDRFALLDFLCKSTFRHKETKIYVLQGNDSKLT